MDDERSASRQCDPVDELAWAEFESWLLGDGVRRHLEMVAKRVTRGHVTAADLVQATLERGLTLRWRLPMPPLAPLAYMITILMNLFRDECKKQQHRRVVHDAALVDHPAPEPYEPEPWEDISSERLSWAIDQLPDEIRKAVELQRAGLTQKDIATMLRISEATVSVRLRHARMQLRGLLESEPTP